MKLKPDIEDDIEVGNWAPTGSARAEPVRPVAGLQRQAKGQERVESQVRNNISHLSTSTEHWASCFCLLWPVSTCKHASLAIVETKFNILTKWLTTMNSPCRISAWTVPVPSSLNSIPFSPSLLGQDLESHRQARQG
jgi:hypothetical protein